MADRGSILALDSFSGEESIRVAAYDRALTLKALARRAPSVASIASSILEFVQGEGWRMNAIDVAVRHANRHTGIEDLIAKAKEITDWAAPPVEVVTPPPATERTESASVASKPVARGKATRKRR